MSKIPNTRRDGKDLKKTGDLDNDKGTMSDKGHAESAPNARDRNKAISLETLAASLTAVHQKLDEVKVSFSAAESKINSVVSDTKDLGCDCEKLKDENATLRDEMDILKAVVVKQSSDIDLLKTLLLTSRLDQ